MPQGRQGQTVRDTHRRPKDATDMSAATAAATSPVAQENRDAKARAIALYAWRHGLGTAELWALPYSSHSRLDRTRLRFAREAYAAIGQPHLRLPGGPKSDTWELVAQKLTQAAARLGQGLDTPARDRLDHRHLWLTEEAAATGEEPYGLPRGWASLAVLGPLEHGACRECGDHPIVVTRADGGRCALHPPRRAEIPVRFTPTVEQAAAGLVAHEGVRDGWGINLDWTPKPCIAPVRCYCGRCPETDNRVMPWRELAVALRDLSRQWGLRVGPGPFLDAVHDAGLTITPDGPEQTRRPR